MLQSVFTRFPSVKTSVTDTMFCNLPAKQFIMLGNAHPGSDANNLEIFFARRGPTFFSFTYAFRSNEPNPDDLTALSSLCPSSSG